MFFLINRLYLRYKKYQPYQRPVKAPGSLFLAITEFLYPKKTQERVFTPIISDMREEMYEAYRQQRPMKAHWIKIRYSFAFIHSMISSVGISLIKKIIDAWSVG